jgi:hypothetical protein
MKNNVNIVNDTTIIINILKFYLSLIFLSFQIYFLALSIFFDFEFCLCF